MLNGKGYDNLFNSWVDIVKRHCKMNNIKMSQYIRKPYEPLGGDINVKVDLCNYVTKTDF